MSGQRAVFPPPPDTARLTYVWAAPLVALGFVALIQLPVLLIVFVGIAAGGVLTGGEATPDLMFWPLAAGIAVGFGFLILVTVFWLRGFERRSVRTAGWTGPNSFGRYVRGVAAGLMIAAVMIGVDAAMAPDEAGALLEGLSLMAGSPGWLVILAALAVMFAIQSGAEEFTFRGWMLSAIAARRGAAMAIIISSITFALAHVHYVLLAPMAGLVAIAGVGFVGTAFAFYAIREGSVIGVAGAHAAYNFSLVVAVIAGLAARSEGGNPAAVSVEAFMEATQVEAFEPSMAISAGLLALIALGIALIGRRKAPAG